jgi:hypothetical protein
MHPTTIKEKWIFQSKSRTISRNSTHPNQWEKKRGSPVDYKGGIFKDA